MQTLPLLGSMPNSRQTWRTKLLSNQNLSVHRCLFHKARRCMPIGKCPSCAGICQKGWKGHLCCPSGEPLCTPASAPWWNANWSSLAKVSCNQRHMRKACNSCPYSFYMELKETIRTKNCPTSNHPILQSIQPQPSTISQPLETSLPFHGSFSTVSILALIAILS